MKSLLLLTAALVACTSALSAHSAIHDLLNPLKQKSDSIEYCVLDRVRIPFVGQLAISPAADSPQVFDQKITVYADFNKQKAFVYQELTPAGGKTITNHILVDYNKRALYLYKPDIKVCSKLNTTADMVQCIPKDNKIIDTYTSPDYKQAFVVRYDNDAFLNLNAALNNTEIQVTTVFKNLFGQLTPFTNTVNYKDAKGNAVFQVLMYGKMSTRFSDDVFDLPEYC